MKSPVDRIDPVRRVGVAICASLLCISIPAQADNSQDTVEKLGEQAETAGEALGDKRFFAMPVPISKPTIGTGLGAITMYLFEAGENAPPSKLMFGGLWADSHSWAGAGGVEVHFKNDTYRLSGWVGYFDVNLKFFGVGNEAGDRGRSVEINQSGPFFAPRLLRRIAEAF